MTNQSTVLSTNCLTVNISEDCLEDITTGDFSLQLRYAFGSCRDLNVSDYSTSTTPLSAHSTCIPVSSGTGDFCYRATLLHGNPVIDTCTNLKYDTCPSEELQRFSVAGVSHQLDVNQGYSLSHGTTATLSCKTTTGHYTEMSPTTCVDGSWSSEVTITCSSKCSKLDHLPLHCGGNGGGVLT